MTKPLILIIEDHPTVSVVFSQALRDFHFDVEIIANGRKALDRLQNVTPQLLLLDLHLPHVSGQQILQHIRQIDRFANTKVILMTADVLAYDNISQTDETILLKPISIHTLRDLVKDLNGVDKHQ
mgnify:CR=1 FL=1